MKKVAILLCALVGLSMGQVFAADLIWRSDLYATDDYWSSADNWRLGDAVTPAGAVPGSGDTAYVILDPAIVNSTVPNVGIVRIGINWGFGGTLNVNAGGSLSVNNLEVNWSAGQNGFVNINGGTLTVGNGFVGAVGGANNAYLTLNSGALNVNGVLHMNYWGTSNGSFDIYGGTASIGNLAMDAGGTTTLYGGTLITNAVTIASATQGLFDFRGGEWRIGGTDLGALGYWVNSGIVKVNGQTIDISDGTLSVDAQTNPGYLTVTLIPEPATLLMLGLGGLLLKKRG